MSMTTVGDLAQSFQLRRDSARLSADLQRYATEFSSGRKSNIIGAVAGDFRALAGLERSLSSLDAYDVSTKEAALAAEVSQDILGRIETDVNDLSASLLLVQEATDAQLTTAVGAAARQKFAAAVTGLNTSVAGRTLFSGDAFDQPALMDPEAILADLSAAVGPQSNAADVIAAVDAFFAPGGGFGTTAYVGSTTPADHVDLGDGSAADAFLEATDPRITVVLKAVATAALIDLGVLSGDPGERAKLARGAGVDLLSATAELVDARAQLGVAQERISTASARISSERATYELARSDILAADPFETATRLQKVEEQIRSLYVITGRLSDLRLTNYLR